MLPAATPRPPLQAAARDEGPEPRPTQAQRSRQRRGRRRHRVATATAPPSCILKAETDFSCQERLTSLRSRNEARGTSSLAGGESAVGRKCNEAIEDLTHLQEGEHRGRCRSSPDRGRRWQRTRHLPAHRPGRSWRERRRGRGAMASTVTATVHQIALHVAFAKPAALTSTRARCSDEDAAKEREAATRRSPRPRASPKPRGTRSSRAASRSGWPSGSWSSRACSARRKPSSNGSSSGSING